MNGGRTLATSLLCALLPALVLVSCHRRQVSAAPDSGALASVDAGSSGSPELTVSLRLSIGDGGTELLPLHTDEPFTLDPTDSLDFKINQRIASYRLRIFDEADRILESDDQANPETSGIDYQVHLKTPLKPGHRYTVDLDGESGPTFVDALGRPHDELRYPLVTTGERQPEKPSRIRRHHHRRHR